MTFAVVLPRIADYGDVWDAVRSLDRTWLLALIGVVILNIVTYAPPWMLALPGLRFRQALPFTQASTAYLRVMPSTACRTVKEDAVVTAAAKPKGASPAPAPGLARTE